MNRLAQLRARALSDCLVADTSHFGIFYVFILFSMDLSLSVFISMVEVLFSLGIFVSNDSPGFQIRETADLEYSISFFAFVPMIIRWSYCWMTQHRRSALAEDQARCMAFSIPNFVLVSETSTLACVDGCVDECWLHGCKVEWWMHTVFGLETFFRPERTIHVINF